MPFMPAFTDLVRRLLEEGSVRLREPPRLLPEEREPVLALLASAFEEHRLDVGEVPVDDRHRRLVGNIDLGPDALDQYAGTDIRRVVDQQPHAPRRDHDVTAAGPRMTSEASAASGSSRRSAKRVASTTRSGPNSSSPAERREPPRSRTTTGRPEEVQGERRGT